MDLLSAVADPHSGGDLPRSFSWILKIIHKKILAENRISELCSLRVSVPGQENGCKELTQNNPPLDSDT